MASSDLESALRSRRPKISPFYQQRLLAWHPMFSLRKSAIMLSVFGVSFIIIGAVLLDTSNKLTEFYHDYTDCTNSQSQRCAELAVDGKTCTCTYSFNLSSPVQGPFFVYYGLHNFYQNHRRYAQSKSDEQLLGMVVPPDSLSSCDPYSTQVVDNKTYAILPCGAIANSIFNDSYIIEHQPFGGPKASVRLSKIGIAWKSDVDRKYGALTPKTLNDTVKPPYWPNNITSRSSDPFKTDENLIVWMRVAALPNFRKLYRRVIHEGDLKNGLPAGTYTVDITYAYPVVSFNGRKLFILGNTSWFGGKNPALGILFIITGCLHLIFGILFVCAHFLSSRTDTENESTPHSTATGSTCVSNRGQ